MKALLTMLILGTSSVALAQPATVVPSYPQYDQRDHRYDDRFDRHDDARFDGRFDHNDGRRAWFRRPVMLASNVSMMRQWNRDQRPMLIDIDQRVGGLRTLEIERNQGRMYVDDVLVHFADGHRQRVDVNQMLSARNPSILINLDHGAVTALSIDGSTMRGRATFDVIGMRR
jgi:hypothetical protein